MKQSINKKSFTLIETLITVALLALIAVVTLVLFDPWGQIGKGYDVQRKHDLDIFKKALEDYYDDKGCYPKPSEICYDLPPTNVCGSGVGQNRPLDSQTCHICGNESGSPSFSPYLTKLPCDPQHGKKKYLYEVVAAPGFLCSTVQDATSPCPQWYHTYSNLSFKADSSIEESDCQMGGCGIAPDYGYDYGVTSSNEKLKKTPVYYCYTTTNTCDNCGASYTTCEANPSCIDIYPSKDNCCLRQPKPISCN